MSGFFGVGTEGWSERIAAREAREAEIDAAQERRAAAVDAALREADEYRDAAQLVELARLLDGQSFRMREEGMERVEAMRRGPRGNDPDYQRAIAVHSRVARLSPEYALTKARAVLSLVRSWEIAQ